MYCQVYFLIVRGHTNGAEPAAAASLCSPPSEIDVNGASSLLCLARAEVDDVEWALKVLIPDVNDVRRWQQVHLKGSIFGF